jgi:hypothetical protein
LVRYLVLGVRWSTSWSTASEARRSLYDIGDAVKFSAG